MRHSTEEIIEFIVGALPQDASPTDAEAFRAVLWSLVNVAREEQILHIQRDLDKFYLLADKHFRPRPNADKP